MTKMRFTVSSTAFILWVSAYFSFALNIKFWQFAYERIDVNSFSVAFFAFSLLFFVFVPLLWFFSLIFLPRVGKAIIIILLILSAMSDYALQNLGIVINSDMIRNFVETNIREAKDLVTLHAFCYVLIVGIIPAILVYKTNVTFNPFKREFKQRLVYCLVGLLTLAGIASVSYKEYASFGRNNKQVRYYINTFNYIYAVGRYYKRSRDAHRQFVILDASPKLELNKKNTPRVTVLIVGETARSQNFSLYGYEKDTNPLLSENKELITFNDVSSCGTATAISLPCMFSALNQKEFDVTDALFTQNLLDIAKLAGYDIIWKDNDDGCKKVCSRVETTDAKKGNKQPYCFGSYCHDDILLDGLDNTLRNITKDTLIVLHMMGSHGPTYYQRYPDKFKKFTPACDTANLQDCTQEQITNTYNNTIVYTDYIIASVIDILKSNPKLQSSMLYVSDHGESLGEKNVYLHGLPYVMAPDVQKKVPMLLWLSEEKQKNQAIDMNCLRQRAKSEKFSHDNYFHGVLQLLQINSSVYKEELSILGNCVHNL